MRKLLHEFRRKRREMLKQLARGERSPGRGISPVQTSDTITFPVIDKELWTNIRRIVRESNGVLTITLLVERILRPGVATMMHKGFGRKTAL